MQLYVVRHAHAPKGEPDEARPLSEEGRRVFAHVVQGLRALGVRLDRIYTSPWRRARQTAELLLPLASHLEETPLLAAPPLYGSPRGREGQAGSPGWA